MKKVSVIGHFAIGLTYLDGQTIKTKIVTEELKRDLGSNSVDIYDTHGGIKTLLKAPFMVWRAFRKSENIIILPAHNGLRIFGRLLAAFKRFFKNKKIHYVVIGGWLPQKLEKEKRLAKSLKKFDCIYVETNTMKKALCNMGFQNILVMPNCKQLTALTPDELVYQTNAPYRLCTFSRVNKEKGIETAVDVIHKVNDRLGYAAYLLDIYGPIDPAQTQWFESLKLRFSNNVRYCGSVPSDESVEVLKNYFALLFPTHYLTEGIPGTIIDAYAAGVPVISAKWQSFDDVVEDGLTGIGYEFDSEEALECVLLEIANNSDMLNAMKLNCLKKSFVYLPCNVVRIIEANMT
ncbi:MAG: glycosyltransferase [Ruminococcaceae bacterium]|nr:glycosyltransferase [Oscillospiraceae bacterium]